MKPVLLVLLLLVCLIVKGQGAVVFLGKDVGEAKFIAERQGITLGEEQKTPDGVVYIMYKPAPLNDGKHVDLGIHYTLYFDPKKGGRCTYADALPSVQEKWVADTIINRLKTYGFRMYDENTLFEPKTKQVASFKYERAYAAPGKPINLHMLKFALYILDAPTEQK